MAIKIPQTARNELSSSLGEQITLSFDAVYFWWENGMPAGDKNGSGVQHYGGWSTDAATLEAICDAPPAKLVKEPHYSRNGDEYIVYATRYLAIAPFAKRWRWVMPPPGSPGKGTGHNQYLCLLAEYENKKFDYWMPAVLSLKGYAAMEFSNTLSEFDKLTAKTRRAYADNAPGVFFWRLVGTFGKERNQKMVGKGAQSPITPPVLFVPKDGIETEEQLAHFYVGEKLVATMIELKHAAQDWLDAWKEKRDTVPIEETLYPQLPEENGEDVPF